MRLRPESGGRHSWRSSRRGSARRSLPAPARAVGFMRNHFGGRSAAACDHLASFHRSLFKTGTVARSWSGQGASEGNGVSRKGGGSGTLRTLAWPLLVHPQAAHRLPRSRLLASGPGPLQGADLQTRPPAVDSSHDASKCFGLHDPQFTAPADRHGAGRTSPTSALVSGS